MLKDVHCEVKAAMLQPILAGCDAGDFLGAGLSAFLGRLIVPAPASSPHWEHSIKYT